MSGNKRRPTPENAATELGKDVDRAAHDLDERLRRFGDATLADYERRRQRLIDDVAGELPADSPEPQ